ncbi:type I-E CRISPR-associated protein Cse1/CasA [Streptomyces lydicus]|uniref:type I-E CRISPR-associated protein Cse1/CasA n=1 Tax=Streptomyces lydicus TaxID=47763 RepID=UPI0037BA6AEA
MPEKSQSAAPIVRRQLSFDLTSQPWLPVLRLDGVIELVSLREVFARAHTLRRIAGDLPTQELALLRLLLAILHDAVDGPRDVADWYALWSADSLTAVAPYLDAHRDRFDLLHPTTPFFQVAELRTAKGEVFSLNRIVADVPNGEPFFSARLPAVDRLSFAEAARWVVHAHAYDTSGIKTGTLDDDRTVRGKVYPLGVGWAGSLGAVFVEGRTLRETLLLNLVAADTHGLRFADHDRPAWRHLPCSAGATPLELLVGRPSGARDLYTWQTRRLLLHYDGSGVHGVVLGYGDPLSPHNKHRQEPMTGWRRSLAQETKSGEQPIYLPKEHDGTRPLWLALSALVEGRPTDSPTPSEPASALRPRALNWISRLMAEGRLPLDMPLRLRAVGAVYGTQKSVIDDIFEDHLSLTTRLFHEQGAGHVQQAVEAVTDASAAADALGALASDLARASGSEPGPPRRALRERGVAALDGMYRAWLVRLAAADDPHKLRKHWQREACGLLLCLGDELLTNASDTAWEGRTVESVRGLLWLNSALAERWFHSRLAKALHLPAVSLPLEPPASADPAPREVALLAAHVIDSLQKSYLTGRPAAVTSLARLRNAEGGAAVRAVINNGGWSPQLNGMGSAAVNMRHAEKAVYAALSLWALHQQPRAEAMHQQSCREPVLLGAAIRRLAPRIESSGPVRKRFVRLGNARTFPALIQHLRGLVALLQARNLPLDYSLLTADLYIWQQPGGRQAVRRSWGRSFHARRGTDAVPEAGWLANLHPSDDKDSS